MINSSLNPEELGKVFARVNTKIALMNKYSTEDLLELSTKLKGYQERIDEFVSSRDNEENQKKLKAFYLKISQIIVDLQFNDIIRQKLEHLEEIHAEIIADITAETSGLYAKILIDAARLSKAQLEFISNEYTVATNNIKDQLLTIWNDKVVAGTIELGFLDILNNSDVFAKQVTMSALDLDRIINSQVEEVEFDINDYADIQNKYTMQSEREVFGELFGVSVEEEEEEIELF